MSMVVWVMMGIAIWHFAVFVPDRFYGGIVGAFLAAIVGSVVFGFLVAGFTDAGPERHRPRAGASSPCPARWRAWPPRWWYGSRTEGEHRPEVL